MYSLGVIIRNGWKCVIKSPTHSTTPAPALKYINNCLCLFSGDVKICVALSVRLSRHTAVHPQQPHQARDIGL